MKNAKINILVPYKVEVVPTDMRYSLVKEMYNVDGEAYCDITYEILCSKYARRSDGELVDFGTPVIFDTGVKTIPFQLYLLIESHRAAPSEQTLSLINGALEQFSFVGSLADFTLQVTDIT